jgi:hypothetical protein
MSVAGRLWAAPGRTDLAIRRNTEMVLSVSCLGRSIALTFRIRSIPNELETSKNSAQSEFSSACLGQSASIHPQHRDDANRNRNPRRLSPPGSCSGISGWRVDALYPLARGCRVARRVRCARAVAYLEARCEKTIQWNMAPRSEWHTANTAERLGWAIDKSVCLSGRMFE